MTIANGRCESEPMACDRAAGSSPRVATSMVIMMGRSLQHRAFDRGVHDGVTARAKLVDVFQHDDAGLHRYAKERQEADAGGHAEVGAGNQQRQQARRRGPWPR